jgi:hypothetical protein
MLDLLPLVILQKSFKRECMHVMTHSMGFSFITKRPFNDDVTYLKMDKTFLWNLFEGISIPLTIHL